VGRRFEPVWAHLPIFTAINFIGLQLLGPGMNLEIRMTKKEALLCSRNLQCLNNFLTRYFTLEINFTMILSKVLA
jgi:hypothetical protein